MFNILILMLMYKKVYPSYKKVSHWYKTQIIDAEAILTSLKNRNLI